MRQPGEPGQLLESRISQAPAGGQLQVAQRAQLRAVPQPRVRHCLPVGFIASLHSHLLIIGIIMRWLLLLK